MALLKCKIAPDRSGYSAQPGETVVRNQLDGGLPRQRQDIEGAAADVTITWKTSPAGFTYLAALYRQTGAKGLPFLVDLIVDTATATERTCQWKGPPRLAQQSGLTYVVTAEVKVAPIAANDAADLTLINGYTP